jgi:uncharacterized damage-inducible protein DinB
MTERKRLIELSANVLEGHPWHAGNIAALLKGVTAEDAAAHPVPGAHSIWELVRHMTAWVEEARARVGGADAGTPASGNWPRIGRVTEQRWQAATSALLTAYRELGQDLAVLKDADLATPVTDHRNGSTGTGMSRYATIHGVIHHAAYHAGQIALLKRALRSSPD